MGLAALQVGTSAWLLRSDALAYQNVETITQLNHVTDDLLHEAQRLAFMPIVPDSDADTNLALLEHLQWELGKMDLVTPSPWAKPLSTLDTSIKQMRIHGEKKRTATPTEIAQIEKDDALTGREFLQHVEKLLVILDDPTQQARIGAISIKRVAWKMNNAVAAEAAMLGALLTNEVHVTPELRSELLVLHTRSKVMWDSLRGMTADLAFPGLHAAMDQLRVAYVEQFSAVSDALSAHPDNDLVSLTQTPTQFADAMLKPTVNALGAVFDAAFDVTEEFGHAMESEAKRNLITHSAALAITVLFAGLLLLFVRRGALAPLHRLQTLLHTAADGIITIDAKGIVQSFNSAAERIFGYTEHAVCGRNISMLMPEPYASQHDEYLSRYVRTREAKVVGIGREVFGRRRDGTVFPMRLAVGKMGGAGAPFFTGIVRDITQEKNDAQVLRDRKTLLDVLHSGLTRFVESSDQHLTYQYLLTSLLNLTQSAYGFIAEVLHDTNGEPYLRSRAITNIAWDDATRQLYNNSQESGMEFRNLDTLFGVALTTEKFVIANDPLHDSRRGGLPAGHPPLNAFLGVPIFHGGKLVGMYGIANRENGYNESLVDFLQPFTSSCGILIDAMRAANERLTYQQNLALAKDAAETANRAKSQFLSSMSHELRTPLNVMLGFAQLLKMDSKSPLNTDQQSEVEQVLKAGWHLLELINGVLDLSKIESGRLDLILEPLDACLFVNECTDFIATLAAQRNITVNNKTAANLILGVNADPTRLKQVLLNLISNALKYNRPNGTVDVTASVSNGRVRISVQDSGQGLTADQIQHLFEPFNRLGMEGKNIEGTGIGLVISKRLIEMMGGVIGVESVPGQGSTFWFELPAVDLPTIQEPAVEPNNNIPDSTEAAPCTVLYIEDNVSNAKLIAQLCRRRRGLTLLTATTGNEGLASARAKQPDVILLDINLPDLDGFAVKQQLFAHEETKNIPVIAISANAMPANIERARAAGFVDYVTKPFEVSHFFSLLDAALSR